MPASTAPNPEENDALIYLPGFPGYRYRPGRSGLDYLDNEFELAHMTGVMLRKLISGAWRRKGSLHSFEITLIAAILLSCGSDTILAMVFLVVGVIAAIFERLHPRVEEPDTELETVDWKEYIQLACLENSKKPQFTPVFRPPASEEEIIAAEETLGVSFPAPLRELLSETNGFTEEILLESGQKSNDIGSDFLPVARIVQFTAYYRRSRLPTNIDFTEMIFFLNTHMDGIYMAYHVTDGAVYAWYPMKGKFQRMSETFEEFLWDCLSGSLKT